MTRMERHFTRLNETRIRQDRAEDARWLAWVAAVLIFACVMALATDLPEHFTATAERLANPTHPECRNDPAC